MRTTWIVAAIVLFVLLLTRHGPSQDDAGRQPFAGRPVAAGLVPAEPESVERETVLPNAVAASPDDTRLRNEYLQLARARADLMDEATLKKEIEQTQRNINELRALQKLQEVQRLLLSLTVEFPTTEASATALRMLNAADRGDSQAAYPDDVGPALNTAAEESPFRRSSASRTLVPSSVKVSRQPSTVPQAEVRDSQ